MKGQKFQNRLRKTHSFILLQVHPRQTKSGWWQVTIEGMGDPSDKLMVYPQDQYLIIAKTPHIPFKWRPESYKNWASHMRISFKFYP